MISNHMALVVGAFALLALIALGVNGRIVEQTTVMLDTEASITSISIGQAMIDEMKEKEFDTHTVGARVYSVASMTPSNLLGPESGESISFPDAFPYASMSTYNDADDYNGYRRLVSTPRMGGFTVEDSVYYVSDSNLDVKSSTQTFYKKIVVRVTHPNMKAPVTLTDVIVYRRYI
jgi:hypothetical protein